MYKKIKPYPAILPHSIKAFPIVQTAKEIGPQSIHFWQQEINNKVLKWKTKIDKNLFLSTNNLIYIHIPFCPFLCHFCPLYKIKESKFRTIETKEIFVQALIKEIQLYATCNNISEKEFNSIYFGGGTPTELNVNQLKRILDAIKTNFNISQTAEITLEGVAKQMNAPGYLEEAFKIGFNRITFGVQSTDESLRKKIGRGDKLEDYEKTIKISRSLNKDIPINVDLMACLPEQTMDILKKDIETILSWNLNSIDVLYFVMMLDTKMSHFVTLGKRKEPNYGNMLIEMRNYINDTLLENGFKQITGEVFVRSEENRFIENSFGSNGSRLNTILALGPSAFGLINGNIYQNVCKYNDYIYNLENGLFPIIRGEKITLKKAKVRAILFSILQLHIPKFLVDNLKIKVLIKRWIKQGLIVEDSNNYKLTKKGALWYNNMQIDVLPIKQKLILLKTFSSLNHQSNILRKNTNDLNSYEKEFLGYFSSRNYFLGILKLFLYKLYLLYRKLPFFDNRSIGFTGKIDITNE